MLPMFALGIRKVNLGEDSTGKWVWVGEIRECLRKNLICRLQVLEEFGVFC